MLGAHVHWGQSLLQRTVNKDIGQALAFGILACNLAENAIDDMTPIVRNCVLLAEEALAQKSKQDVASAVDQLTRLVKKNPTLSDACQAFLDAAATFVSSSSASREPPR